MQLDLWMLSGYFIGGGPAARNVRAAAGNAEATLAISAGKSGMGFVKSFKKSS